MKGANQNTAESTNGSEKEASNFNKIRQFVVDSPFKNNNMANSVQVGEGKAEKPDKPEMTMDDSRKDINPTLLNSVNSPNRRSSVDLSDLFFKSGVNKQGRKKLKVDDFMKIKELGSGKYGRVYLVR